MRTESGFDRLVTFSDAVVAIAITLVVLPLVDTARDSTQGDVAEFLDENALALAAAALSFVVIASLWRAHHSVFGRLAGTTRGMVRMNFVWLGAIAFFPLPTVLIFRTTNADRLGTVLYIGTMLVATTALAVIAELARRADLERELDDADAPPLPSLRRRWIPAGLMALALVLAAAVPGVGTWALLVLLVSIPVERLGRRRTRPVR